MTTEKKREIIEYYNTCKMCDEEFQLFSPRDTNDICLNCGTAIAIGRVKAKLIDFIGAKVTCVEPVHQGTSTCDNELEFIEIELADGRHILFSVAGWEEHYIKWETRGSP